MIPCFCSSASWKCAQYLKRWWSTVFFKTFDCWLLASKLKRVWQWARNCLWVGCWSNFLHGSDFRNHWVRSLCQQPFTPHYCLFGGAYPAVHVGTSRMQFVLITLQKWRWVDWGLALILRVENKENVWMWSPDLGRLEHEGYDRKRWNFS